MQLRTKYLNVISQTHPEIINWRSNYLNQSLYYSCRETSYDRKTFPSRMHCHDYYELVIYLEGDINYICESLTCQPEYGDVILIPPHKLHMSAINAPSTVYKRHVFYLYPDALDAMGCSELLGFLSFSENEQYFFRLGMPARQKLCALLMRLEEALKSAGKKEHALALGLTIEAFFLLNEIRPRHISASSQLPQNVLDIQHYIDEHFPEIGSVSEISAHFYYSREYISRLFRRYFNTTVAEYIMQRRVAQSQVLIAEGRPLSDVCFQVGFGSMTTFIRSFRSLTKMTPGQYRSNIYTAQ